MGTDRHMENQRKANADAALKSENYELSRQIETGRKKLNLISAESLRLAIKHCRDCGLRIEDIEEIIKEYY